jgi:surfeit locus 1 family protein
MVRTDPARRDVPDRPAASRIRVLLRPRWLVAHVVVLTVAILFVNLGLWQLRRLDERRDSNALISQRLTVPAEPLADVLDEVGPEPAALAYRRVTVDGRYVPAEEVLLSPRSDNQEPGHHVVTPLVTEGGQAVLIDRGWVPFALDDPPVTQAAPPAGDVHVEGIVMPDQTAHRFGSRSGTDAEVDYLSGVDVARLQPQIGESLYDFYVLLGRQQPSAGALPRTPERMDLGEGPHLSYALQWFSFALIGLVGYPLLIRKSLREPVQRGETAADGG